MNTTPSPSSPNLPNSPNNIQNISISYPLSEIPLKYPENSTKPHISPLSATYSSTKSSKNSTNIINNIVDFLTSIPSYIPFLTLSLLLVFGCMVPYSNYLSAQAAQKEAARLEEIQQSEQETHNIQEQLFAFDTNNQIQSLRLTNCVEGGNIFYPYRHSYSPSYLFYEGRGSVVYESSSDFIGDLTQSTYTNYVNHLTFCLNEFRTELAEIATGSSIDIDTLALSKAVSMFSIYNMYHEDTNSLTLYHTKELQDRIIFIVGYDKAEEIKSVEEEIVKELMFLNLNIVGIYKEFKIIDESIVELVVPKSMEEGYVEEEWIDVIERDGREGRDESITVDSYIEGESDGETDGENEKVEEHLFSVYFELVPSKHSEVEYLEIINGQVRWLNSGI